MRRSAFFVAPLAAVALAVFASSADTSSGQSTSIDAGNFYFCAASFQNSICDSTVTVGSTVTWQVSSGIHTVTQCDASFATCPPSGGFDSGLLNDGDTFAQTFNTPGTIAFYCSFHPGQMRGRILVQAPTATPVASTPGPGGTPAPTTGATAAPSTVTSGPAQVPSSGGPTGSSVPWAIVALGVTLLVLGGVAGAGTLATVRIRAERSEN